MYVICVTPINICTHNIIAAAPPRKRRRTTRKSKVKKAIESTFDSFMRYQMEAENVFKSRRKSGGRQMEFEEKRQQENREHEMRMMQMLAKGSSYYDYEYSTGGGYQHDY